MVTFRSPLAVLTALALLALAAPAQAQFPARGDAVVGEDYNIELSFNFWNPTPEAIVNSEEVVLFKRR